MTGPAYFDEAPERGSWRDEDGPLTPCDDAGPYATRCTLRSNHRWSHYDGNDDSSWTDRWRDEGPDDDDTDPQG